MDATKIPKELDAARWADEINRQISKSLVYGTAAADEYEIKML